MAYFFERVSAFLRRHYLALALMILVSLVYGSEHIFLKRFVLESGGSYYPVAIKGHFDEGYYAIRAARALGGDFIVGDPILREYQETPASLPIATPLIFAGLGAVFGSLASGYIASDFILPPLIFFLVYLIAFEMTGRRLASLLFASVFIFAPKFGVWPSGGALPFFEPREFYFSRFDYPAATFPFFAVTLYFLARLVRRPSTKAGVFFGLSTGLLFYTYFFDWVYVAVATSFIFFGAVIFGRQKIWRSLLSALPPIFLVSVFYWHNFLSLRSLSAFPDIIERIGVERGRMIRFSVVWFSYVRVILLSFLLSIFFKIKDKVLLVYLVGLILPTLILLNIQLVTGFVPQPDHWQRTAFFGLALGVYFILLNVFYRFISGAVSVGIKKTVFVSIVAILIVWGFWNQHVVAKDNFSFYKTDKVYAEAYNWILKNTSDQSIFGTLSPLTNDELVLFTGRFVFVPNGFLTLAPTDEIWQRLMWFGRMSGLSAPAWESYVSTNTLHFFGDQYGNKSFNAYFKNFKREIPKDVLSAKAVDYERITAVEFPLKPNYVIIGPRERALGAKPLIGKNLRERYNSSGVQIYEMTNE